jgi:hypothetical protein
LKGHIVNTRHLIAKRQTLQGLAAGVCGGKAMLPSYVESFDRVEDQIRPGAGSA